MALLRGFNLRTGAMRMSEADSGFVREAYEVLEDLDRQTTVDGVIDVTRRALTRFGFDFFCFNTFPKRGQRFEDVTIAIHVPPEWVRIYNEREYVRIDPSIRYCRQMVRPFRWSDAPYDPEREPEVLPFLKGSADFALTNGFWFPIPGRHGTVGGSGWAARKRQLSNATCRSFTSLHSPRSSCCAGCAGRRACRSR